MDEFALVLLFAALPAAGNFVGGLLAEVLPFSRRGVSLALHAAAGVLLAVVGLELMPAALDTDTPWVPIAAFVAGGGAFVALERAIGIVRRRMGRTGTAAEDGDAGEGGSPWGVFAGVSIDLFADGVMIGTGSIISPALGLLLALGQVPADVPEGFATMATLRQRGVRRRTRILLAATLALPVLLGATLGYWILRGQPELLTLSVLALTGGLLTTLVIEEIVGEAHESDDSMLAPLFITGGFAVFALISAYGG